MQTHLMLQADNTQIILFAGITISIGNEFRNHEQADPLRARHTIR